LKSRVIVGAAIALATLLAFAAGFVWSPKIVAASALLLGVLSYMEIATWQDSDSAETKLNHMPAAQLLGTLFFSLFAFVLFTGGSVAFFALALRNLTAAAGVVAVAYAADTSAMSLGKLCAKLPVVGKTDRPLLNWAPSKTIAGFIGGYLGGLAMAFLAFSAIPALAPSALPTLPTAALFLMPAVAIFADLLGSAFKRCSGIKDSGEVLATKRANKNRETTWSRTLGRLWRAMLPHGGFLDRFGTVFLLSIFIYLNI
jgi:CDP-diglyceride synthetase